MYRQNGEKLSKYRYEVDKMVKSCRNIRTKLSEYRYKVVEISVRTCRNIGTNLSKYRYELVEVSVRTCRSIGTNLSKYRYEVVKIFVPSYGVPLDRRVTPYTSTSTSFRIASTTILLYFYLIKIQLRMIL